MLDRRDFLRLSAAGASLVTPAATLAQPAPPPGVEPARFGAATVRDIARELSRKPYAAPANDLPAPFNNLAYDQYVGIRMRPEAALWAGEGLAFVVEPLHRGAAFWQTTTVHVVENGLARPLGYDPAAFDFGRLTPPARLPALGFSGLRILRVRQDGPPVETALFQGASTFRAVARGQNSGVMARALAIATAEPKGEQFPYFPALWIERPAAAAPALTLHALLDSESVTGAYRFTLRPGDATVVDVEATLFPRVALDHVGLAPMQATSLFGPLDRRRADDPRAAVYEVSGLQMETGAGEYVWRPVSNRESLQISSFVDQNPKRFGLVQRERDFDRFFDDDQHWELRPTLLVEPIGEWGAGGVQLVEIPADSEANDNVIAYWRPKAPLAAGAEIALAYRQIWCWDPPEPPPLAIATLSRSGRIGATRRRRFIVEFTGPVFADPPADLRADVTAQPGAITLVRTFLARERKRMRVVFDLDPAQLPACELRLVLVAGGKPLTETWLYRWTTQ
ncbi:MAG: glucan biosynthesis protein [Methylobacteriaceae bacterium]|nr:glucan biosynthesis protein [Methylobacteriaceae bacterium]